MVHPRKSRSVNPQGRRKFTPAQIRAGFGGKRRQAALKSSRRGTSSHKHRSSSSNPKRSHKPKRKVSAKAKNPVRTKVVYRTKYKTKTRKVYVERPKAKRKKASAKRRRTSSSNPYAMLLSPVTNPQHKKRRKKSMAKPKRKVSAKRSGRRHSSNPKRRSGRRSTHRPAARRSSNPFGQPTGRIAKVGFGVFIGASTTKKLPQFYPAQLTATPAMAVLSTLATAAALAWGANQLRFTRGDFAEGVLWGGIAQTINVAWNAFAPPPFSQYATLGDLRDFVPGQFPLPNGPVRFITAPAPELAPNGASVNMGAWGRSW
jgi:hypothetical protein